MCIKILLIIYSLLSVFVDSTFFDQSQSGDLNVQVDLKGLHIIALMKGGKEEYVDYDYAYDYSDMTIKPQNRTTPRPLNVTSTTVEPDAVKDNVTITTTVILEATTPTQAFESTGVTQNQTIDNENSTVKNKVTTYNATDSPVLIRDTTVATTSFVSSNTTTTPTSCKKGFVINSKGDCELQLQGAGNALLKLVKLSQKMKLRRENKSDNADSK
ncbi:uncharacterized protein [Epargyreus clarus]|uniref:uncharacterized protein n=1 Tax=Epargyreus clarus TaxID=520877 RepID=UPI003C2C7808